MLNTLVVLSAKPARHLVMQMQIFQCLLTVRLCIGLDIVMFSKHSRHAR